MILVAVGANLPGAAGEAAWQTCRKAAAQVGCLPGLALLSVSRWYRSVAVPDPTQPDYVNGVLLLSGAPDPAALLAALQKIEQDHGRVRSVANAARTLDLDIIDIDGLVRDRPDPILPHPRAFQRAFVLLPLAELAPGWIEPRLRRTVADLIADLPGNPEQCCGAPLVRLDWPTPYCEQ